MAQGFFLKKFLIIKCTDLKCVDRWVLAIVYIGVSANQGYLEDIHLQLPTPWHP